MMSKQQVIILVTLVLILFLCTPVVAEGQYPHNLRKYVTDYADLFGSQEIILLNDRCAAIEKDFGIEIAIVTVPDTGGQEVIQYATMTGEVNGVGSATLNNGVVILFSLNNQPGWAIATGRGAEEILTDAKTSQFLRDADPMLDQSQYFAGTEAILQDIRTLYTQSAEQTTAPQPSAYADQPRSNPALSVMDSIIVILAVIVIISTFIVLYFHYKNPGQ